LNQAEQSKYFSENVLPVGADFSNWYLNTFVAEILPKVPEEGRIEIVKTLTNEKYLEYQLRHTGLLDFSLNENIKMIDVLNGLLGIMLNVEENGQVYAVRILQMIVLSGSIQRDVMRDLWRIKPTRAMELLKDLEPDFQARLISQSSSTDIIRSFEVGIFDKNKQLLGSSFGESISQAECDAAVVALAEIYEIGEINMNQFFI